MTHADHIDRALSPWLYEDSATPPQQVPAGPYETRLQSAGTGGGGTITLTPATMYASSARLAALRTEVEADVNTALLGSDHTAIGANLQISKAVQHVHDRWQEKLKHVLSDMQERVERVRKAADNWEKTEQEIAQAYQK